MRVLVALGLVGLVAVPAAAYHCEDWTTFVPLVGLCPEGDCTYLVQEDFCSDGGACHPFQFWIYHESNGIVGLQRDDEYWDDTCHGMIVGDTIIF